MSFESVKKFENLISGFFGSKYGIATDSCTHAIELCLRYNDIKKNISFPTNTYIGIPMLGYKLDLDWSWNNEQWSNFYYIKDTNIVDAAVFWKKNSYIDDTFMCVSFQFQKHINIGRGGMILTNSEDSYKDLTKMSYDGRERDKPWRDQNISSIGYHYYMTPENAEIGINIFNNKFDMTPKLWTYKDYPDLSKMNVFNQ
ncbi:DegT/DnrJ/EryC1/StrS family aminotransferase [Alphaproteobacteria bacterium]|nr:DegT/DnrJ/EryC1/StrS family aminotransferase [Alphaproteobacteria bacterium]